MNRRDLILLAGGAVGLAYRAVAQTTKAVRIGILAPEPSRPIETFKRRMQELGWVEGRNARYEARWAGGDDTRYAALAAELVALRVDVILTWSTPAVLAAKRATATIPIVMGAAADPVGVGAVASLPRPGGNVTGFSTLNRELEGKRLELLGEIVPHMTRIAVLAAADNPYAVGAVRDVQGLAAKRGITTDVLALSRSESVESALPRLLRTKPDAVLVIAAPVLYPYRVAIVEFMAAHRLPAVYPYREFAEAGGLISYATSFDDLFRQAAVYVDKVLRGTAPGALPVQQADTFEMLINLKTAKMLGLAIPPTVIVRATEVIE